MAFEVLMRDCAIEEDRRRKEADALDREQGRLQSLALIEAMQGNTDKLWSAVDYADHEKRLMRVLMWARVEVVWYFHCDFMRHYIDVAAFGHIARHEAINAGIHPLFLPVVDKPLDSDFHKTSAFVLA